MHVVVVVFNCRIGYIRSNTRLTNSSSGSNQELVCRRRRLPGCCCPTALQRQQPAQQTGDSLASGDDTEGALALLEQWLLS